MRILIVEDNARMAELVAKGLTERGYSCDLAGSLASAEDSLASAHFDLVLLDLGLPDGDGLKWIKARRKGLMPPTLVLTARDGLEDRVKGLDAGADDYLAKPFEMSELAARVRAILRRPGARMGPVIEVGELRYDVATNVAHVSGTRLDLSRREEGLFELLMRRAGQVVRRMQIEEAIYNFNESVTPNAIEAIVSRLRRKLEDAGGTNRLHTIRGVGYLLSEE
jgi:two-component system, OmpR family, response regulator QseB